MKKEKFAFPAVTIEQRGDPVYNKPTEIYHGGMTLRDYFAGQALAGMLASCSEGATYSPMSAAGNAYELADAMLAEREKGE